jgi:hypothetical protein
MIYESVQMVLFVMTGSFDIWNIIDLFRVLLIIIYCVIMFILMPDITDSIVDGQVVSYVYPDYLTDIFALFNFLTWIRFISYLRLFKKTRALIRLLLEVIKDMMAFGIVLTAAIFAFATTFNILNPESNLEVGISSIKQSF